MMGSMTSFQFTLLIWSLLIGRASSFSVAVRSHLANSLSKKKTQRFCRTKYLHRSSLSSSWGENHDGYEYNREEVESSSSSSTFDVSKAFETDWWQAELTLMNAPSEPSPHLTAQTVALNCVRSLQWVDYPTRSDGLKRCYQFLKYSCREVVTARRGGKTIESFVEFGLYSPALQPFMGASKVEIGECTFTPAKPPLRGALASYPVKITGAAVLSMQHLSGMQRGGISSEGPPITNMVIRLEQQRRPPNQGCWLVHEIMDVRQAFAGDMGNAHVGG